MWHKEDTGICGEEFNTTQKHHSSICYAYWGVTWGVVCCADEQDDWMDWTRIELCKHAGDKPLHVVVMEKCQVLCALHTNDMKQIIMTLFVCAVKMVFRSWLHQLFINSDLASFNWIKMGCTTITSFHMEISYYLIFTPKVNVSLPNILATRLGWKR